ncbi:hypothetical protein CLIM01_14698 [Colletotrichum limetticola]|uniref:Uncharacterized protein n=1 Tax=Colletotrichum limetticola TaxID=1209924 RepID=A0ABQ9P740_9PEZI|nr:hypothetical protein CLIM01_14698 [Colletotrichum limetticola]
MIKGDLGKVGGVASDFSIQAVVSANTLGHDGATHHGRLDDHKSGARDIYTASIFNEETFSRQGLSLSALKRIFNGHSKEVTGKKPKMDQMYGGKATYGSVELKNLLEVTEVKQALGLDAASSGMES